MNFEPEHSYNAGRATRTKHKKTIIEWIVYKTSHNGSLWYWAGDQIWVEARRDAKGFDDVATANAVAQREGGKAVKR